jgi:hypothetical protein
MFKSKFDETVNYTDVLRALEFNDVTESWTVKNSNAKKRAQTARRDTEPDQESKPITSEKDSFATFCLEDTSNKKTLTHLHEQFKNLTAR